jgi:hypothetical protein
MIIYMERKYIIESKKYGDDNRSTSDKWITTASVVKIKEGKYIEFIVVEGEHAGKKHYIPFSNIHSVREI